MQLQRGSIAFAAAVCLYAGAVFADETAKYDPAAAFAESDGNADGKIDPVEFEERLTEVFFANDGNKDGTLDAGEYDAAVAASGGFGQADASGDGKVSMQEFIRDRTRISNDADESGDGALSIDEVEGAWQVRTAR